MTLNYIQVPSDCTIIMCYWISGENTKCCNWFFFIFWYTKCTFWVRFYNVKYWYSTAIYKQIPTFQLSLTYEIILFLQTWIKTPNLSSTILIPTFCNSWSIKFKLKLNHNLFLCLISTCVIINQQIK
jgi:hypothetical protein